MVKNTFLCLLTFCSNKFVWELTHPIKYSGHIHLGEEDTAVQIYLHVSKYKCEYLFCIVQTLHLICYYNSLLSPHYINHVMHAYSIYTAIAYYLLSYFVIQYTTYCTLCIMFYIVNI